MPLLAAAGIMAGDVLGGLIGRQKAPAAAQYKELDPQAEQKAAIAGNMANEGDIEALLTRSNAFTQDQANSLMEKAIPGWGALSSKLMKTASDNLENPYGLPQDVQDNLSRIAAERGVSTGINGQAREFSALKDLGLNMLNYGNSRISQSQGILTALASTAPRVNPMSPASLYVTPAQQISAIAENNAGQYNAQQSANNAAAAASNANASMWGNIISNIGGMAGVATGQYLATH